MKKINETYVHETTGIEFNVEYNHKADTDCQKKIKIMPSDNSGWVRGDKGFVFNRSKTETIKKIGQALLEIGEFCEKL